MIADPTCEELLKAVAGWLNASDEASDQFQRRVARNAIGIVLREFERGTALKEAARQRMAVLLGREGSVDDLNVELAKAIRKGQIACDDPMLLDHLRRTALDMLAIDQPLYAHMPLPGEVR